MKLSDNFTLEEMIRSAKAKANRIDNFPQNLRIINSLDNLAKNVLQPARSIYGKRIDIGSGFRCEALNALLKGAKNSQHTRGEAADLDCKNNKQLFEIIRDNCPFDQLIWEFGDDFEPAWVHVSFVSASENRHRMLRAVKIDGKTKYNEVS